MVRTTNDTNRCTNCDHVLEIVRAPRHLARFGGVTLRVPETMGLLRCSSCGLAYPTPDQLTELHKIIERDLIGYDNRGIPVLRNT